MRDRLLLRVLQNVSLGTSIRGYNSTETILMPPVKMWIALCEGRFTKYHFVHMGDRKRSKTLNDRDASYFASGTRASGAATPRTGTPNLGTSYGAASRTGNSRAGTSRADISRTGTSRAGTSRTGTSRAGTSRTALTRVDDAFVIAIIENNMAEVGLCAYNLNGFEVELRQHADSNSFSSIPTILCIFK